MANLQRIQNNMERSEFETKTRLGAQIEALERDFGNITGPNKFYQDWPEWFMTEDALIESEIREMTLLSFPTSFYFLYRPCNNAPE